MNQTPWPFPTAAAHPTPSEDTTEPTQQTVEVQHVSESTLDHAVEESFPASDPVSVVTTKVVEQKTDKEGSNDGR
ncbi:MAG: hypothetical protein EOO29_46630 [Comamonadaceae bacterium]|nr:MAG: hypothetical protein EOO29_46630 [Comamonadaceae bacterium]